MDYMWVIQNYKFTYFVIFLVRKQKQKMMKAPLEGMKNLCFAYHFDF